MTKHRRSTRLRKAAIAVAVTMAVSTPAVALASDNWHGHSHGNWQHHQQSQSHHWWSGDRTQSPSPTTAPTGAVPTTKAPATAPSTAHATPAKPARATPTTAAPAAAAPTTAAPATAAPAASGPAAQVVSLVNTERQKAGCAPLTVNAKLTQAAQAHSEDMAAHRNMSHTGSDGSSPGDRITRAGYNWSSYGENVAYGYSTPQKVMAGWMSSPGHKRNILDCSYKEIGVGLAQPGDYWTQDFGTIR